MSRRTGWRSTASDAVRSHQDQGLSTTMFLLRSFGPTAFLLKEEGQTRNFKVCLGERHGCTCPAFTREEQPCKHICWLLLKKFKLPREHQYAFQPGLSERQLLEVLQAEVDQTELDAPAAARTQSRSVPGQEAASISWKVIQTQDVCPICLEGLLEKKQPVTYCKLGCGNSVHISCMKVWADHQSLPDSEGMPKCPLCRENFSSLKLLLEQANNAAKLFTAAEREEADRHLGVFCCSCRVFPVTGTCFRCTRCSATYFCKTCVEKGHHSHHPLASRATRKDKWISVSGGCTEDPEPPDESALAERRAARVLERAPAATVRHGSRLLDEGLQCRLCLQRFSRGQQVRTLPCHHKFHIDCVDQILLTSNSCPLDGYVIYSQRTDRESSSQQQGNEPKDLFVPGVAMLCQRSKPPALCGAPDSLIDASSSSRLRQSSRTSPLKKIRDNMAAGRPNKKLNQVTVGDAAAGSELRITGVSLNTQ